MPEPEPLDHLPLSAAPVPQPTMGILFLVVFIDLLGFGLVLPLLPVFGRQFIDRLFAGGQESASGGMMLGLLMSSFSLMQFLFAPAWGRLSDRVGRRPVLLIGLAGSVVFYSLFGYASDLPEELAALAVVLLFVARLGAGMAGATIATAQAVIADCTPPEQRKQGMALIGAAFGMGFTFGPLLGAGCQALYEDFHGLIGYSAAGLSLGAWVLGWLLLPETRMGQVEGLRREIFNWRATREVLGLPGIGLLVLIFFLATFGFGGFESTVALLNEEILRVQRKYNYLIFTYIGLVLLLTQGWLYRRLAQRLNEMSLMTLGVVFMGTGLVMLAGAVGVAWLRWLTEFEPLLVWMMTGMTAAVVGFAFLTPSLQALISRRTSSGRQGEVLGVNQSASALARILGPFVALTLYKVHASRLLPFALAGVLLLALLPLVLVAQREK